jgi:hypothetical protein
MKTQLSGWHLCQMGSSLARVLSYVPRKLCNSPTFFRFQTIGAVDVRAAKESAEAHRRIESRLAFGRVLLIP